MRREEAEWPRNPPTRALAARVQELEARERETQWHLARLAALEDPLDKFMIGVWEQLRLTGLADSWGRSLAREEGLVVMPSDAPARPDFDAAQNEAFRAAIQRPYAYDSLSMVGAAYLADAPVTVVDLEGDDGAAYPATRERIERVWAAVGRPRSTAGRSAVALPMRLGGERLGVLMLTRNEVRPFTEEEIAAIQPYADQMALAIGNARAAEQLEQRNRELGEALERETATADVLRVISMSPGDIERTLPAIGLATRRLCEADHVTIIVAGSETWRIWDSVRGFRSEPPRHLAEGHSTVSAALVFNRPVHISGAIEDWEEIGRAHV